MTFLSLSLERGKSDPSASLTVKSYKLLALWIVGGRDEPGRRMDLTHTWHQSTSTKASPSPPPNSFLPGPDQTRTYVALILVVLEK